jgi:prevent-host-death family protein
MAANRIQKRIGKAQARDELSALIDAVNTGAGPVEITDYGKVAAVLLSEKEYEWLCANAKKNATPKRDARGVISLSDDSALDDAAKQLAADFDASLTKTASEL